MTFDALLVGILGLCFGSFVNVLVDRSLAGVSCLASFGGRSCCEHCATVLRWFELIPLFSFLVQRGRCRSCMSPLSWYYPLSELLMALVLLSGYRILPSSVFLLLSPAFVLLVALVLTDVKAFALPYRFMLPLLVWLLVALPFRELPLLLTLAGASAFSLFFILLIVITRGGGMGGGDVLLAFALGLLVGWPHVALIPFLAFFSGALFGCGLLLTHRAGRKTLVPFGPFLIGSALLVLFFPDLWWVVFPTFAPLVLK